MTTRASHIAPTLSRSNPLVRRIRLLSRSPEERERAGIMLAEGIHLATEALAQGIAIHEAIVSPRLDGAAEADELMRALSAAGVSPRRVTDELMGSLHHAESQQGILLVVERPAIRPADLVPAAGERALLLVACGVQDPGNVGSLVRVCDAAGVSGMLVLGGGDPFGPKAVRASAGSIFRLPVSRVRSLDEAVDFADRLRREGVLLAGAVPRGGATYKEVELPSRVALFVGAEGSGLPEPIARLLHQRLTIPMRPPVESINVATAAGILLFESASRIPGEVRTPPARARASQPASGTPRPRPAGGRRR